MRGYFDEDEPEPERPRRDTELTLGAGAVLGLVSALLLVCGLCFAAGYTMGHHASAPSAASNGPIPAPDQEPLQANGSIPKPSASAQPAAPAPQPGDSPTNPDPGTPTPGENPTTTEQSPGAGEPGGPPTGSPEAKAPSSVKPAQPAQGNTGPAAQGGQAPNVHTALPASAKLMVQIAAVAHPEDADVLATALRKRGYSVTATREPSDGLIHVRIGPFNSRDEANRWRDKLLGDGYNAVVQP
ncbi:MAG: SPOR domain-containing protein [Terracidiphilus sp.]|nr:SPOR domain-containing protein [Terracidiphilus sp.]MDR3799411.1 SPOR domain-containing protein [Terracidiphilus sp.]